MICINGIETKLETNKKKLIHLGKCSQNGSPIASVKGLASHDVEKYSNGCVCDTSRWLRLNPGSANCICRRAAPWNVSLRGLDIGLVGYSERLFLS